MKKVLTKILTILVMALFVSTVFGQKSEYINGTEQIGNHNFETFINLGGESEVPLNWSSFMTATGSQSGMVKSQQVWRSTEKRPGTTGQYSVKISSRNAAFGIIANGNLTTGRVNAGSMTATSCDNYNYTERANATHNHSFTSVPDSVVVWVKSNAAGRGSFEVIIHNDNNTKAPCTESSQVVAYANPKFDKNGSVWQRLSQAFDKNRASKDPRYCLINASTNETPSEGSTSDEVWFDDLLFVYNPKLTLGTVPESIGILSGLPATFNVPYTLTGTMNPYNNLPDNEVIVELSNANGSFATPTIIGRLTTFTGGTIACTIPSDIARGTGYRIRLRSTNYPMTTDDNGKNIEIFSAYMVNANPANSRGVITGMKGLQRQNTVVSLTAVANPGNIFTHWSEESSTIADIGNVYTFLLDKDRNLTAHFDTASYQFNLTTTTGGNISGNGGVVNGSVSGNYIHNSVISLQAVAAAGYEFSGYFEGGVQIAATENLSFAITKNRDIEARFTARRYLINVNANNGLYGSVTGGGMANYNSAITLRANVNPYCEFVAWLEVGSNDTLGKDLILDYTVTKAVSITGVFAEIRYPVVINRNPVAGGTVSGAGTYSAFNANTTITLTANAAFATGYNFKNFTDDSTGAVYTQNPFVYLSGSRLTSAKSFTANFELRNYNITVGVLPVASGSVSGAGAFVHGTNVILNAVAAEGYEFVAWLYGTSDTVSKSSQISFTASRDTAFNALFRLKKYSVNVLNNNVAYGSISGAGTYEHFSAATLTATANEGYEFRYWLINGEVIDSVTSYIITVTEAVNVEANFSIIRKNVSARVLPLDAGTVSGTGRYEHNTQVTLTANANTGYSFVRWEDTFGNEYNITPTIYLSAISDTCLVARFEPIPYTLTIFANNINGEVSFNGINYTSTIAIDTAVPFGTTLPLFTKVVSGGYKFVGWKKAVDDAEVLSVADTFYYTVTKDEMLRALFSNTAVSITATVQPAEAGIIEGNGNYETNSWYPITAVPDYGYRFVEWRNVSGEVTGTENPLWVEAKNDTSFVALLEKDSFNVAVSIFTTDMGVVAGSGLYCYQDTATLIANNNENYHFVGWYENDILVSTDTELKIEVERAYNLTAIFDSNEVVLTVLSSHPDNSVVSVGGVSKYGRVETLTAVAGEGIHFIGWLLGSDTLSVNILPLQMLDNYTVIALFDTNKYNLNVSITSAGGCVDVVEVTSCTQNYTEKVYHNSIIKLVPIADNGYHFEGADTMLFVIKKDTNINIEFLQNNIIIQTSCDVLQGYTSISGSGGIGGTSHLYGESVRVEASSYNGYHFIKWVLESDTSVLFSTYPLVSFIASSDTALVALFAKDVFNVSLQTNNTSAGKVSMGGLEAAQIDTIVEYGSSIIVSAQALYGYSFSYWQIDGTVVSTDIVYELPSIIAPTSIVAVFEAKSYSVQLLGQPSLCGDVLGSGIYTYGSTVQIKAIAENNFFFDRWISDIEFVSFDSVYSFIITKDTVLTAIFRTDTFNVSVDVATVGGSVAVTGQGTFLLGQEVAVEAESDYGYVFSEWQDNNGSTISRENPYVFNATENINLRAVFIPQTFNVTINSNASNADIRGGGNYHYGDDAYLFALSNTIYTFVCWELLDGDSTIFTAEELLNNVLFYPVEKDLEIRAVYDIKQYSISAIASPTIGGSVFNMGNYAHGSSFRLEAIPAANYHFVNWVYKGAVVSEDRFLDVDSVSENMHFIATFEINRHDITLACTPSAGGVLNGSGKYSYGDTATLSVSLKPGYTFRDWLDKDFVGVGNETTIKYIVKGDNYITARLIKETSTEDVSFGERVSIYPNPVSSLLYIDGAFVSAGVFDFTGKEVMRSGSSPINVSSLKAGVYVLRIEFSDGAVLIKKLVIS
jgi:hypothetical protein